MADPSLLRFRTVVAGALGELEARRQEVNDLNVFPVADGDTGDNMALTLRAVLDELDRLSEHEGADRRGRPRQIVDSVARAALLGARGNSGVILSQLIRGAAEELISRPGELVDPVLVAPRWRAPPTAPTARCARRPRARSSRRARDGGPHRVRARPHPAAAADRREPTPSRTRARRGARARARRRRGVGQARARPAAGPARGGRRRRRRLRPDRHLRGRRRGAARRRPPPLDATPRRASPTRSTTPRPTATARTSR